MPDPTTPQPAAPQAASSLITSLEWIYDKVQATVTGGLGIGTDDDIDHWIALASTGAGAIGFVANVGGIITLPVAIPANLASTATIQLSLVAKIIAARGYDPATSNSRAIGIACLVGSQATAIVNGAGVQFGQKIAQSAINHISGATLTKINQAVGFRLVTKAGEQGIVNLTKFIPLAGGLVGGAIDAASTYAVGAAAKQLFPRISQSAPQPQPDPSATQPQVTPPRPRLIIPSIKQS